MKIAGLLQVCDRPCWKECFNHYVKYVDSLCVRFDIQQSSEELRSYIISNPKTKKWIDGTYYPPGSNKPDGGYWREPLLRLLDNIEPDIVVFLDIDERFESDPYQELEDFYKSDKIAMMCSYNPCPTEKGTRTLAYPSKPHMIAYKWQKGLTYLPYRGFARVTNYTGKTELMWNSNLKIEHYCMWTKEMEEAKLYGRKGKL